MSYITRDVVAGLTIGLMLIPQSFAYAELAGLDPYLGLYAAFIGVAIYTVLGSAYIFELFSGHLRSSSYNAIMMASTVKELQKKRLLVLMLLFLLL